MSIFLKKDKKLSAEQELASIDASAYTHCQPDCLLFSEADFVKTNISFQKQCVVRAIYFCLCATSGKMGQ